MTKKKSQKAAMHKRQKAAAKKRQKAKIVARRGGTQLSTPSSSRSLVRQAREFPVMECLINSDWDDEDNHGLVRILLTRRQPDGAIIFGSYLVDMLCLGLKDTFCNANIPVSRYRRELVQGVFPDVAPKKCPIELAHQIVYEAIDYAAQFGFKPQKDFKMSQYVLEERGTLAESYNLTFGKDGKPLFVAGPYDNSQVILAKLEKHAGPGNYNFLVSIGPGIDLIGVPEEADFDELPEGDE
jgi:hypothetical protein